MIKKLRIGTRGSKLALAQAAMVCDALKKAHPDYVTETKIIQTSGDWKPEQGETRLSEAQGGKGLFAREIERAILKDEIDCGVHSLKDMPSFLPDGLMIRHMLERADSRDVFLSNGPKRIEDLPLNATVGTASLRRQALLYHLRPDLKIMPLRGNVPTRIEKLRNNQVDGIVLAAAGLKRLGLENEISSYLEMDQMLPAACQGIIGIEMRHNDTETCRLFDAIHHPRTGLEAAAERGALATLDGSCHTPIGAQAVLMNGIMRLRVLVASMDGKQIFTDEQSGPVRNDADAANLGQVVGMRLRARVPPEIFMQSAGS